VPEINSEIPQIVYNFDHLLPPLLVAAPLDRFFNVSSQSVNYPACMSSYKVYLIFPCVKTHRLGPDFSNISMDHEKLQSA
jgi:hypothetical protein